MLTASWKEYRTLLHSHLFLHSQWRCQPFGHTRQAALPGALQDLCGVAVGGLLCTLCVACQEPISSPQTSPCPPGSLATHLSHLVAWLAGLLARLPLACLLSHHTHLPNGGQWQLATHPSVHLPISIAWWQAVAGGSRLRWGGVEGSPWHPSKAWTLGDCMSCNDLQLQWPTESILLGSMTHTE